MERSYDDGTEPTILPHYCCGPCNQGRKACPTPWACQQPDPDEYQKDTVDRVVEIVLALACIVCIAFIVRAFV